MGAVGEMLAASRRRTRRLSWQGGATERSPESRSGSRKREAAPLGETREGARIDTRPTPKEDASVALHDNLTIPARGIANGRSGIPRLLPSVPGAQLPARRRGWSEVPEVPCQKIPQVNWKTR